MGLGFKIIDPHDDPNQGRNEINYNFSILTGITSLNLTGFTSGGSTFDIVSGTSENGLLTLITSGGGNVNIVIPKVSSRIISGFSSSYSTGSTLDVTFSGGSYAINGIEYTISTATTLSLTSGLTDYDRYDAIVANTSSGISILSGTAAQNPIYPIVPDTQALLAYVSIPGQTTQQAFNGNRTVKRSGLPAINAGGDTLSAWVESYFFPFIPATVSINSSSLREVGNQLTPSITYTLTVNDETIVNARRIINVTSGTTVANPAVNSTAYTASAIISNNTWRNEADVDNNGSPGTITSSNSSVSFIYPFFYGMDDDAALTGNDLYTSLTKSVANEGTKSVSLNGTDKYIYFVVPTTWDALSKVVDPNGFDVTSAFESSTRSVTSSGLFTNYTEDFTVYRTSTLTEVNSGTFQFQF